ncbi:MAG: helix-turn-helix domain-containing protein, partial [Alteraurantiacibacter sp.]
MSDNAEMHDETDTIPPQQGVGAQLRGARESKGLTVDQVAAETRISSRHIQHIEAGEFDQLTSRTYAIGFSRTLAKAVGLNENDVVAMVRGELDSEERQERRTAAGGT